MRKTLTTVALLLALSCTAFGGEILIPPAPAQSDGTIHTGSPAQSDGIIQNGEPAQADTLTQIVLSLLVSALS